MSRKRTQIGAALAGISVLSLVADQLLFLPEADAPAPAAAATGTPSPSAAPPAPSPAASAGPGQPVQDRGPHDTLRRGIARVLAEADRAEPANPHADPFQPPAGWDIAKKAQEARDEVAPPAFTIDGVITGGAKPMAVIDGDLHRLGDTHEGWRLVDIRADRVVVQRAGARVALPAAPMPELDRP
ncbi:MAG: hypothetical protein AAGA57_11830 [Planctomycetota bacterium]